MRAGPLAREAMMTWSPSSWRDRPIRQQPTYDDPAAVQAALDRVRGLPPLVSAGEIDTLRERLAACARGEAFLLQGGDCAERFSDCAREPIESKLKILLQMSMVLTWGARLPVVRLGRMAGQYAKPRSSDTERIDGIEVPSYRGDHVNSHDPSRRTPDPARLVEAYFRSSATLNYVRALLDGGFADLRRPDHWDLGFVRSDAQRAQYRELVHRILDALHFVDTTGVRDSEELRTVEWYASHEGLLLPYEEAQTERIGDRWYNVGAHMLWIGHRTRALEEAHVEYFRGIANPIGIKVGPGLEPEALVQLLDRLDPDDTPGRITLITRFGADHVAGALPPLIEAVRATGRTVLWSSDPMHGNTITTEGGLKTRPVSRIFAELVQVQDVHAAHGSILGGVHFELTGENVTECTGGPEQLSEADLSLRYHTLCDPRLNYAQSLHLAFLLAEGLAGRRAQDPTQQIP